MRYFLGFLVTIGLIILIIVLLLSGRGGNNAPTVRPLNLADYTQTNSTAQMIVDGPINADQSHDEVRVEVTANKVTATVYKGYQQTVVQTHDYANNQTAYAVFLHALQHSGFTLYDRRITGDERGFCPAGKRYILNFNSDGKNLRRSWSTSCGSSVPHSFTGQVQPILNLFKAQVPDFSKLTAGTDIS
jgi:hypothetical protein